MMEDTPEQAQDVIGLTVNVCDDVGLGYSFQQKEILSGETGRLSIRSLIYHVNTAA